MPVGYSKRTLAEKLGISPKAGLKGFKVIFIDPPSNYKTTLGKLPENVILSKELNGSFDLIQFFTTRKIELESRFPILKKNLLPAGMLWISWPKGSAKMDTDLNENIVRQIGLEQGMVDIKVCAVDETWSGLKFVLRIKDRK